MPEIAQIEDVARLQTSGDIATVLIVRISGSTTVATLYDKIAAYQASLAPLIDNRNADKG